MVDKKKSEKRILWSNGAHSVIVECFEKNKVRLVEVSIGTACYS